jgi:ribosomal protein S12 methylthiotransferase
MKKVAFISLGCSKNLVDSELILGLLKKNKIEIVDNIEESDIIIINTCGFIESAKKEAIDTILECIEYKKYGKKVIVTGCLSQRYKEDLLESIPEVDEFIKIDEYDKIGEILSKYLDKDLSYNSLDYHNRYIQTMKHFSYVKISEGCNNNCTYCAIPLIRGKFRSRNKNDILLEIKELVEKGVKEVVLISQDITRYGTDFLGEEKTTLAQLLEEIVKIKDIFKVRILYMYPDEVTDELLETMKNHQDTIIPYFDLPVQHASSKVLKLMNRRGDNEFLYELFKKIRSYLPNAILRTTLIVGFPQETNEDFKILKKFVEEIEFNHLGAFTYSREEDTKSYDFEGQINEKTKVKRLNEIMDIQKWISLKLNRKLIGTTSYAIIEGYNEEYGQYIARNDYYAPDDIDGYILVNSKKSHQIGDMINVKIKDCDFYDLVADEIE